MKEEIWLIKIHFKHMVNKWSAIKKYFISRIFFIPSCIVNNFVQQSCNGWLLMNFFSLILEHVMYEKSGQRSIFYIKKNYILKMLGNWTSGALTMHENIYLHIFYTSEQDNFLFHVHYYHVLAVVGHWEQETRTEILCN